MKTTVYRMLHKVLATIVKNELKDQLLEGFIDIFRLVSLIRCFEPMPIHNKEGGDLLDQWQHLKQTDLKALNRQLEREHLALLDLNTRKIDHDVEDQIEMGDDN